MEMHFIAYNYHWSYESLVLMTSKKRKSWVKILKQQKKAEADSINKSSNQSNK